MQPENKTYFEAHRFLSALDCTTDDFHYQTFDDLKSRHERRLAGTVRGTLKARFEYLKYMNSQGAGIFVAVNAIKPGRKRKIENLERVRAIWQDDDNGFQGGYPIPPSIVVQSSPGKYQRLWVAAGLTPNLHQAIMRRLIQDYGSDPEAHDLARVLRLPGFLHMKDPTAPHRVELLDCPGWIYSSDQLAAAFPPIEPEKPKPFDRSAFNPTANIERLLEALSYIDADARENWLRVGAALRLELGEDGREIWDAWSKTSAKFNEKDQARTWYSFKRCEGQTVTLGTVFHLARTYGFRGGHRHAA